MDKMCFDNSIIKNYSVIFGVFVASWLKVYYFPYYFYNVLRRH